MANYTVHDESKRWRVISLRVPTVRGELYKALAGAEREYEAAFGREAEWDDAFTVDVTDNEIVIRIELPKEKT